MSHNTAECYVRDEDFEYPFSDDDLTSWEFGILRDSADPRLKDLPGQRVAVEPLQTCTDHGLPCPRAECLMWRVHYLDADRNENVMRWLSPRMTRMAEKYSTNTLLGRQVVDPDAPEETPWLLLAPIDDPDIDQVAMKVLAQREPFRTEREEMERMYEEQASSRSESSSSSTTPSS